MSAPPRRRFANLEGHRSTRAPRRGLLPTVSVVVASNRDWQALQNCLAFVLDHCSRTRAEIVVARAALGPDIDTLARVYPTVGFVEAASTASIAQLRAIGMRETTGDVVVFIEDSGPWDARRLDAFVQRARREGGASPDDATSTEADWASYLAEHGIAATAPARPSLDEGVEGITPMHRPADGVDAGSHPPPAEGWLTGIARAFGRARRR